MKNRTSLLLPPSPTDVKMKSRKQQPKHRSDWKGSAALLFPQLNVYLSSFLGLSTSKSLRPPPPTLRCITTINPYQIIARHSFHQSNITMRSYTLHLLLVPVAKALILDLPNLNPRTPTFPEPTSPPASQPLKDCPACQLLGSALGICASLTPDFTTLAPTAQARCLCYSSTIWQPHIFDDAVKTCADYACTAAPAAYTPLLNLEGFCNGVGTGDGNPGYGGGGGLTTITVTVTTTVASGGAGDACAAMNGLLNSCTASTNGFATMAPSEQAKCLCYSSSSWLPTAFDGAVGSCSQYAQTGQMSMFSIASALGGFCQGLGNALAATTTPTGSSSPTSKSGGASSTGTSSSGSGSGSGSGSQSTTHTTIQTTFRLNPVATITATEKNVALRREASMPVVVFFSFAMSLLLGFL